VSFSAFLESLPEFVRVHQAYAPWILGALTFVESLAILSLIVPAWTVIVAFGPLIGATGMDFTPVLIGAAVGAALGDWVSYWFGYHYRDKIGGMWPLRNYPKLLPQGRAFFERFGWMAIFIGRFSGPLRASVPLVAGMTAMSFVRFQIANILSAFLWAFVLLKSGEAGMVWLKSIL
jgi:membrane protein DedA with SNARE-associated domain